MKWAMILTFILEAEGVQPVIDHQILPNIPDLETCLQLREFVQNQNETQYTNAKLTQLGICFPQVVRSAE